MEQVDRGSKQETKEHSHEDSEENKPEEHKVEEHKVEEHKTKIVEPKPEPTKHQPSKEKFDFQKFYNKNYKLLLLIPIILLISSLLFLTSFQSTNGDIIYKDITLSGGTSIQVNTDTNIDNLRTALEQNFEDISIRSISDVLTGKQLAIVIETTSDLEEIKPFLENQLGFTLNEQNSSIEFTGSSLSESFYNQLRFALVLSFILMALVVFIIFRTFIPSIAVVFAAFGNIIMTLAVVNFLEMKLSTAGIVAFLMLIGYSVDTDILLTTRVIKRKEGSVNSRILSALKTGMTMTLTSLLVVLIGYFLTAGFSKVFSQIFTILIIGLIFDLINTWLFNASIIKWYAQKQ
tara:strand:- start:4509 stop:5549 length:1041 start_codon:yes stop_codon:yes gene_type:complete